MHCITNWYPGETPWPDPVDDAELRNELVVSVNRVTVLPPHAAEAIAAWVMHRRVVDASPISPILAIESPTPEWGKSTLQDWLGRAVDKPVNTSNATTASVFRLMDQEQPTLLLDEADTLRTQDAHELRGILNSGHRKSGAFATRTRPRPDGTFEFENLSTWGAKSIACISTLHPTLQSRSIVIPLQRKLATEIRERIEDIDPEHFRILRSKLTRWADDQWQAVAATRPILPAGLGNRAGDNWRELFRIGMLVGSTWPARLESAALALSGVKTVLSDNEELLKDIKGVFERLGVKAIHTQDLITELCKEEERPWGSYNKSAYDKSINPKQLATLLSDYGISPKTVDIRIGDHIGSRKGYKRDQFEEAFIRYL